MQAHVLSFLALELADQRAREAQQHRLAREAAGRRKPVLRRFGARIAASVGIALARLAVRMDQSAAEPIRNRLIADQVERLDSERNAFA
jgi:hypothetical protein